MSTLLQLETEQFLREREWRRALIDVRLACVGVRIAQSRSARKRATRSPGENQPGRILHRVFPAKVVHR